MELDAWYRTSFPLILQTREPNPFITTKELQQLMKWKLTKGKWSVSLSVCVCYQMSFSYKVEPSLDSALNVAGDHS